MDGALSVALIELVAGDPAQWSTEVVLDVLASYRP